MPHEWVWPAKNFSGSRSGRPLPKEETGLLAQALSRIVERLTRAKVRRVRGIFGNMLALQSPLEERLRGTKKVSTYAPLTCTGWPKACFLVPK